jgi:hypothetical protein
MLMIDRNAKRDDVTKVGCDRHDVDVPAQKKRPNRTCGLACILGIAASLAVVFILSPMSYPWGYVCVFSLAGASIGLGLVGAIEVFRSKGAVWNIVIAAVGILFASGAVGVACLGWLIMVVEGPRF